MDKTLPTIKVKPRTREGRNARCPACEQLMNHYHAQQVAHAGRTVTCLKCSTRYCISMAITFTTKEVLS